MPNNPTINGFVFEAPFFSELFSDEVRSDLYPLLGLGPDMIATRCGGDDQQAFDARLRDFLNELTGRSADGETLTNLDELIHLATSILIR